MDHLTLHFTSQFQLKKLFNFPISLFCRQDTILIIKYDQVISKSGYNIWHSFLSLKGG